MTTLLIAEHDNKSLNGVTAKALTAAVALGGPVHVLVAGENAGAVAEAAGKLAGVEKVLLADGPAYAHRLAEPLAALIVSLAGGYDAIVGPSTAMVKNVLPRVAALLDVMQISDIVKVVSPDTFERPHLCGQCHPDRAVRRGQEGHHRAHRVLRRYRRGRLAPVESVAAVADPAVSSFVEEALSASDRPELTAAKIIVSGGRAVGSREKIRRTHRAPGGCAGCSRGRLACSGGCRLRPNDWQVGQTGKVVAPELYVALGISGAIQHLAGMKDSKSHRCREQG